jgi:hypothetical protein
MSTTFFPSNDFIVAEISSQLSGQCVFAWAYMTYSSASGFIYNGSLNCRPSRSLTGTYYVSFNNLPSSSNYSVHFNGWSGSNISAPTMSLGFPMTQGTAGFTMSIVLASGSHPIADFVTGSLSVFSY